MSAFIAKCPECGREFTNYHEARRFRCSVGCDIDAAIAMEEIQAKFDAPSAFTPVKPSDK
jgi:endogenous inhibitor of DNA gyrase (YacG/DUF329 family)